MIAFAEVTEWHQHQFSDSWGKTELILDFHEQL
jgi:hypothetical protein